MDLPAPLRPILEPLFTALPLEQAMPQLVVKAPSASPHMALVEELVKGDLPDPLKAALWLYVDELDQSHRLAQKIEDQTGSYWHGIMHRREGDFSNSHYWFNKVGQHPAMALLAGYDPHAFIDAVEKGGGAELVELQRWEWANLFGWCAQR
ncbi:MAG: hypothetical protein FJY95_00325 [Candidatus Handelsmanbacteria bacterium]|nr:hypothetical protein [Candidatus Handelsmanbacteria bacterium]